MANNYLLKYLPTGIRGHSVFSHDHLVELFKGQKKQRDEKGGNVNPTQRLDLIDRTARWCYDQIESWGHGRFGEGLAYLLWAIAANDSHPFDSTACPEDYAELVLILKSNPSCLWDELTGIGAII